MTGSLAPDRTLQIVASRARAAAILRHRAAVEGVALGLGVLDQAGLEARLLAAAGLEPISPVEARLTVAAVAAEASAATSLARLAGQPGFASAFLQLWDALRSAGIDADGLSRVAERLGRDRHAPALTTRRFAGLAAIARAYEQRLARGGRVDPVGARVRLPAVVGQLGADRLRALIEGARRLVVEAGVELPPIRARLWEALARAGIPVAVEIPLLPARLGEVAAELAHAIELRRRHLVDEAPSVELLGASLLGRDRPPLAVAGLIPFVSAAKAAALVGPELDARLRLLDGEDQRAELRAVAAAIRELIHAGVAPHRITVAAPRLGPVRSRLRAALELAELPFEEHGAQPLLSAGPLRLSLALLDAAERELPREALAELLESAYVGRPDAAPLITALREAGSRDDRGVGHLGRLRGYAAKLARGPHPELARRRARARLYMALADGWARVFERLRMPARAPIAAHVEALFAALHALDIPRRSLGLPALDVGVGGQRLVRDAVAAMVRDRAALEALEQAAEGLIGAGEAAGVGGQPISLAEFRDHLEAALAAAEPRPPTVRGAGVQVTDLAGLAAIGSDYAFVISAVDGELPGAGPGLPLLDDDDRQRLERAAGRPILAGRSGVDAGTFALACAGVREQLTISGHRQDADGREVGRSRYFTALAAVLDGSLTPLPAGVVPTLPQCSSRGQLLTRLAQRDRAGQRDEPMLTAALEPALAWARGRAAMLGHGRVELDARARRLAHRRLGFAAVGPTVWRGSATSLEDYAACPFRFFAARVLRLRPRPSSHDDLDAAEQGSVRHEVLAAAMLALRAAGLTPLVGGDRADAELRVAVAACERVLDRWQQAERTGPAPLWLLHRDLVVRDLVRLLEGERRAAVEAWEPGEFEVGFGVASLDGSGTSEGAPLAIPDAEGERRFELVGRVDRIDYRGDGREREGLILDYKSGRVGDRLRVDQIARTQLQLPLYAAWLAARRGDLSYTDAAYVSLRDGERSHASLLDLCLSNLELDGLLRVDPAERAALRTRDQPGQQVGRPGPPAMAVGAVDLPVEGQRNLADNVWALLGGVAAGRFDVRPHDPGQTCRHCPYASVCRIERGDEPPAGAEPEPTGART